jgi:hypothetical protein
MTFWQKFSTLLLVEVICTFIRCRENNKTSGIMRLHYNNTESSPQQILKCDFSESINYCLQFDDAVQRVRPIKPVLLIITGKKYLFCSK